MKITCGSCAAKYTVSDDKVQGKTVKVKCRKCGAVIVVSSTGDVQTTGGSSAGAPAPGGDATYTVSVSDTDQRNMTQAEIIAAYNEGVIDAETYVWAEGMDDWQPLKDIDSIVDALHEAATGEPAGDDDLSRTVAMSDPAAALGSYGGAAQPAPAVDHFGASTVAMSSPADAGMAAAPAGTTGNFFGSAGGSNAGSGGGAATAAASSTSAENSAIFSLNMLTAKVGTDAAPAKASTGGSEDSGLIDLKALAAGMGGSDSGAGVAAAAPAGGLFPLGAPPPVAATAPTMSIPAPAQSGPNRGMVIGLAAAVVVLGAALVFILVRDSGPPPTTASTTQPTAAATPTPAPTPTETAPATEPSAVASAAPSASATTKVATKGTTTRPTTPTKPTAGGPSTAAPPAKPPSKPAGGGGCGCSPDDLMCHMRCSQKK